MSLRALGALVLLTALSLSGSAVADNGSPNAPTERRRIVAILDVRGTGNEVTTGFEKTLESQIDTKQYWLVPRARLRERMANSTKWTDGCFAGPCLAEVKVQTGADIVLMAALTGSGTSFGYVVTLLRTDTGAVLSQEGERCEVCTLDEAMSQAILATIRLLVALPDQLPGPDDDAAAAQAAAQRQLEETSKLLVARAEERRAAAVRFRKHIGTGLLISGLVVAGAGLATYVALDDHERIGLGLLGAGGGLLGSGIVLLAF